VHLPRHAFGPTVCSVEKTLALADLATRLKALDDAPQKQLISWG